MKTPELLAPAGDWANLRAAVQAGADAVYFAVDSFNMRARAKNFPLEALREIVDYCHHHGVKTHLTLNTIIYQNELPKMRKIVERAKSTGVDMVICWDMSVIEACKKVGMPFCVSTQASVSNAAAANAYHAQGARRLVLARECTLAQIAEICQHSRVEIECFVHGAMCLATSGRCLMSQDVYGKSANRGECLQPCRRKYQVRDESDDANALVIGSSHVLSPKDLCTVDFIDKIMDSGVHALKIEGRMRSAEYVDVVVGGYRKAVDLHAQGTLTQDIKEQLRREMKTVYNRGFSTGYYLGAPGPESWAHYHGSRATSKRVHVGRVLNYFQKSKIAHIKIEARPLQVGDPLIIVGDNTGVVRTNITRMLCDGVETPQAPKGSEPTLPCAQRVRLNDQVYLVEEIPQ